MEPIAVVGFSFKGPQDAVDESSLWEVLENRRNLMTEWPADRCTIDVFHDGASGKINTVIGRGGHFMKEDPSAFDAPFFSVMPKEASAMDPQQRWLMETSYHAFENAGMTLDEVQNSRTAVFEASMSDDYIKMFSKDPDRTPVSTSTGNANSIRANRVSWHFGLLGPSVHVDTACSSSLIAMNLACQSIESGDADAALVLGCNLILGPEISIGLGNQGFLSPSSLCYSFDHRANGYARGEGVVAMVIKPLSKAIADGNMIRALIRATGSNSDGHTPSMTQPSAKAQETLIRHVYKKAGLDFHSTRYFEAHGTGTPAGDPIEMKAIGRVFRTSRSAEEPLYVGSIKSNLGHLEGAAGLAGIVKSILMLEKGIIPPNALFEKLNPDIDAEFYHTEVPVRPINWPSQGVRRISVNSFGMGGANAHIILDDALSYLTANKLQGHHQCSVLPDMLAEIPTSPTFSPASLSGTTTSSSSVDERSTIDDVKEKLAPRDDMKVVATRKLLVWTANDEEGASRVLQGLKSYYETKAFGSPEVIERMAFTLSSKRTHLPWRAFSVINVDDPERGLSVSAKPVRASMTKTGLALVFTGQGAQYANMGLELVQYPVVRSALDYIDGIFKGLGSEWSLFETIGNEDCINRPEYSQPLCTALQIGLVELLKHFGVVPTAVVGHSSGEIAAAYTVGALSMASAAKVAYFRGQCAGRLRVMMTSSTSALPAGAMMSVNMAQHEAEKYLRAASTNHEGVSIPDGAVHIACINSPSNVTLSGPEEAIDVLKQSLDEEQIFAQKFNTGGIAYHSPSMRTVSDEYLDRLGFLTETEPVKRGHSRIAMASSVTGTYVTASDLAKPQYWVDNLVSPVQFYQALSSIVAGGVGPAGTRKPGAETMNIADLIEVGPHSALRRPVLDTLKSLAGDIKSKTAREKKRDVSYSSMLVRNRAPTQTALEVLGQLFCNGHNVSILAGNRLTEAQSRLPSILVDLPEYPFNHANKYWEEPRLSSQHRIPPAPVHTADGSTTLLGKPVADWNPLEPRWRNFLSVENMPWIGDHIINSTHLLAGTCMVTMAIEASRQNFASSGSTNQNIEGFFIKDAQFISPVIVSQTAQDATETVLQLRSLQHSEVGKRDRLHEVKIWTISTDKRWKECFRCLIQVRVQDIARTEVDGGLEKKLEHDKLRASYDDALSACDKSVDPTRFYEFLRIQADVNYRGAFGLLQNIHWDGTRSGIAQIELTSHGKSPERFPLHPRGAVLDAAAHLSILATSRGLKEAAQTMVLSGLSNTWISSALFEGPSTDFNPPAAALILTVSSDNPGRSKVHTFSVIGLSDARDVLFSMDQVEMASVSSGSDGISAPGSHNHEKIIYGVDWKPQLSLMSSESLQKYLDKIPVDQEGEDFMVKYYPKIESAMTIVARHTLRDVSSSVADNPEAYGYLKNLVDALAHFYGHYEEQNGVPLNGDELESLLQECETEKPSWKLFSVTARSLTSIIRGETDPLALLFSEGLADSFYASLFDSTFAPRFHAFLELSSHENPGLKILEVGAGTGGMTRQIMSAFRQLEKTKGTTSFSRYTYTDISPAFFENAREQFHEFGERFSFKTLDLEKEAHEEEGFELGSYDLIFAGSVLHATASLSKTLQSLRRLLKPDGYLVFLEITAPHSACGNVGFGVHPGWWLSSEEWRQHSPLIDEEQWDHLLKQCGFSGAHAILRDYASDVCHFSSLIVSQKVPVQGDEQPETPPSPITSALEFLPTSFNSNPQNTKYALIIDENSELQVSLADILLERSGWTRDQTQILRWYDEAEKGDDSAILAVAADPDTLLISLLEVSSPFLARMSEKKFGAVQKLCCRLRNLLWVTRTGINDSEFPFYSAMNGFLRVVRAESLERYIVTLAIESLSSTSPLSSEQATVTPENLAAHITTVVEKSFTSAPAELEYIVKGGLLGTWKLVEEVDLNLQVHRQIHPVPQSGQWLAGPALELSIGTPGVLDSFRFQEDATCNQNIPLAPNEVEIEGKAWPLSFRDLLVALGRLEYNTPGLECAGIITRVGSAVAQGKSFGSPSRPLQPGDRVLMAMGGQGTMRTYPRGNAMGVQRLPDSVSFEAAAAALNPAMTAYHGLVNMARLQKGESVLIHSAAGATGQMAIGLAKMVGAEIYATVGHDAKKRLLIDEFDIPADHIFYSRDTSFAKGIKRMTKNGVDVVLNSLSGEALRASWECIAPYGRFVEIGKADIMSNASLPMKHFQGNTSFFAVDLFHMCLHNASLYQEVLSKVLGLLDQGFISNPRPLHCFPMSDVEGAFRFMQSGKNTGRIIIKANREDTVLKLVRSPVNVEFEPGASYLIVGGLGGIGRAIMAWMADHGAKNLITFSRSGLSPSAKAAYEAVTELRRRGVRIHTAKCDVASASSLEAALKECAELMPPIKGAINASMDIYDTPFESMTYDQWNRSLKSKISTSFNMHQHLPVGSLDFFILLSSLAGVYGTVAQSNYAAGCTFQDAIARQRADQGENAASLDVGWMRTVGKIAETEEYQRNRENQRDMLQVETDELLSLLAVYCQPNNRQKRQVLLGAVTPEYFLSRSETPAPLLQRPMFTGFAQLRGSNSLGPQGKADDPAVLFKQATDTQERAGVVVQAVMVRLARALGISTADVEPAKLLSDYGVDSLMAVELRNWIRKEFKASVAVFDITSGITILALGDLVAERTEI